MGLPLLINESSATASKSGATTEIVRQPRSALFELDVTAAAAGATDTLDVYVQHSPDQGTTWYDFAHFPQVLGNGGALKRHVTWHRELAPVTASQGTAALTPAAETLAANTVLHGPKFETWRVRAVIAGAGASFSFKVTAALFGP